MSSDITQPVSLYVHVPFCEQKCAYCDFFTVTDPERKHPHFHDWLDLCLDEYHLWTRDFPELASREIATIFFGGGTPSLLPPDHYSVFLTRLRSAYTVQPDAEISLETQPGTMIAETIAAMAHAGINRFSVGIQTFQPRLLLPTARRHTVEESRRCLADIRATGQALSLDLICALPGQTIAEWQADLDEAISHQPQHISVYEMTYHAGTDYYRQWRRGQIHETDEDTRIAQYRLTQRTLASAGFEQYEISNYSLPGHQSRHNRNYWQLGDFIGLGAGAHGFLGGHRYANPRSASDYARAIHEKRRFARDHDSSDPDVALVENLQMALRLIEGVNLDWLATRLGQDIRHTRTSHLHALVQRGWVTIDGTTIRLTDEGILQADTVAELLL